MSAAFSAEHKNKNSGFAPDITDFEEDLKKRAAKSIRARTKAAIVEKEKKNAEIIKAQKTQKTNQTEPEGYAKKEDGYDDNTLQQLNEMSIEEAFEKGLI